MTIIYQMAQLGTVGFAIVASLLILAYHILSGREEQ
jgi:hypothetical protein